MREHKDAEGYPRIHGDLCDEVVPPEPLPESIPVVTADRQAAVQRLEAEVASLERALATRELTGQATGLLAAWLKIGTGEAWEVLRAVSNQTNVRVREVARLMVAVADGSVIDAEGQRTLRLVANAFDTARIRHVRAAARNRVSASPLDELATKVGKTLSGNQKEHGPEPIS